MLSLSPTSLRAAATFTENFGFEIPHSAPGTYSVKHPVQQSGDHREDGGLKGLEIIHKQPDISLEKSYFSSMTEHHTLQRQTEANKCHHCSGGYTTHTDTQSFGFSISAQFPEIIRFLNVGSFQNNILGIPLAVQWIRPWASNAGAAGWIPGQGTKIPHAMWHGQK